MLTAAQGAVAIDPNAHPVENISVEEQERRRELRKLERTSATFAEPGHPTQFSCTVQDMSFSGANLITSGLTPDALNQLPDQLVLLFPHENREVPCKVMWRSGTAMGVKFTSFFREISPAYKKKRQRPAVRRA